MKPVISQILRPRARLPILDRLRLRARFCFSFDKLTKTNGSIIRVSRDSDLVEIDIGAVGNGLDLLTLQSFIGSSGASVSIAYDRSGSDNHATNSSKNQQPRIAEAGVINIVNDKPFLHSLSGMLLNIPISTFQGLTSGALMGVFKQLNPEDSNSVGGIARISRSGSANHLSWSDGNAYTGFLAANRYQFNDYQRTNNLSIHTTINTGNPGQITLYKNARTIPCNTIPTNDFITNPSSAFFPDTQYGGVDISELIILDSVPTSSQRQSLEIHRRKYFRI